MLPLHYVTGDFNPNKGLLWCNACVWRAFLRLWNQSHLAPVPFLTAEAALQSSLWGVCCSPGQPETWAATPNCPCHIAETLDFTDTLEQFGSWACCWQICVVYQPLQGTQGDGRDSPAFNPFWLLNFAYGSSSGTPTTGQSCQALVPGPHRIWAVPAWQLWWGDAAAEMRGKKAFLGLDLLFLCVILIARTPPLPLSYPTPHWTQFLVCGLYLFGFAFFLVVFHAEISVSLVGWEVFWSTEGFVQLGLSIGRKCRYWGEGDGIVSWKSAFRCFGFFL